MGIKVTGLNHLTLRVSDLEQSISYFCELLSFSVRHRGMTDAYLECGALWLALLERPVEQATPDSAGMDHFALTIADADFDPAVSDLISSGVNIVQGPLQRGTGRSVYFHGPDGIVIELHTSDLDERMTVWK